MSDSLSSKYSENVSTVDRLVGRINFLKRYPSALFKYRRVFSNYLNVARSVYKRNYPIEGILRDGRTVKLNNEREAWFTILSQTKTGNSSEYKIIYDIANELIKITQSSKAQSVTLSQSISNGDVWAVFVKQEYGRLPVKGKIVLDIGANIGDSSIYFALQDAKKIVALEPFPKNYRIAKHNIRENNLESRINLLLAGCSDRIGEIAIDDLTGDVLSVLTEIKGGVKVPLLTLQKIVEDYQIFNDAILKMDCEGCEYDSILSAPVSVLKKFSYLQLEYHYGYRNIFRKLKRCGFKVTCSRPTRLFQYETRQWLYAGSLFASRIN